MKALCTDGRVEFISEKLKNIYKKKSITIKYIVPYKHEENRLMEQRWRTIVIMKESLLVDNGLSLEFQAEAMDIANYPQNKLPTKTQRGELILEKKWTGKK